SNWPTDPAGAGYMMAEVHYYPYQYSLMTADEDWGKQFYYYTGLSSSTDKEHNMGWNVYTNSIDDSALGTPKQMAKAFGELKTMFCDKGIPVIIGELGAVKRTGQLTGDNLKLHLQGRALFYGEVAKNAKANGIIPYVWDTGAENENNMTIITRQQGVYNILDPDVLNAMRKVYDASGTDIPSNLDSLINQNPDIDPSSSTGVELTYTSKTADSSETGTMRINLSGANKDLSKYTGIEISLKGSVKSAGPCSGHPDCSEFAWASMDVFMMTGDAWDWFDASVLEQADKDIEANAFTTVKIMFKDFRTEPSASDLKSVNAIGLNMYGTQVSGTVIIDYIKGIKADGSTEIINDFDKKPSAEGTVTAKIVAIDAISAIAKPKVVSMGKLMAVAANGSLQVTFATTTAGLAQVTLLNSMGQVIAKQ
ncbi:MAG: cellulase family glycosylhydrolase, partial [Fibrobacter sp.]|nr:cellulase family glycosylhydrolase [Fibrobacter sp.]